MGREKQTIQGYDSLSEEDKAKLQRYLANKNIQFIRSRRKGIELLTLTVTASVQGLIPDLLSWLHEKGLDLVDRADL